MNYRFIMIIISILSIIAFVIYSKPLKFIHILFIILLLGYVIKDIKYLKEKK
jgi:uncharacterized membrane protein